MDTQTLCQPWDSQYPDPCTCGGVGCPTCQQAMRCPRCGHPLNHEAGRCPGCDWRSPRADLSMAWRDLVTSGAISESLSLEAREVMEYLRHLRS